MDFLAREIDDLCRELQIESVSLMPGCMSYSRELQIIWERLRAIRKAGEFDGNLSWDPESRKLVLYR